MALRKNEGKTYIKEMLEEFDVSTGQDMLPMLDFMFGSQEIQTYLGIRKYPFVISFSFVADHLVQRG